MYLVMQAAEMANRNFYQVCSDYFARWRQPKSRSENLAGLFAAKRREANKQAQTFKATASEGLSLFLMFAFFLGWCSEEIAAYVALTNVLEQLQAIPHGNVTTPESLRAAIDAFLQASLEAGWRPWFHPKWHWILHTPQQLRTLLGP